MVKYDTHVGHVKSAKYHLYLTCSSTRGITQTSHVPLHAVLRRLHMSHYSRYYADFTCLTARGITQTSHVPLHAVLRRLHMSHNMRYYADFMCPTSTSPDSSGELHWREGIDPETLYVCWLPLSIIFQMVVANGKWWWQYQHVWHICHPSRTASCQIDHIIMQCKLYPEN